MTQFVNKYEYVLRDNIIKNYLYNTPNREIKIQIEFMLKIYNIAALHENQQIIISPDFPENELIKIMKPYLHLKLLSDYSLIEYNKLCSKQLLILKLYEFQQFNPLFGRKIIKIKNVFENGKYTKIQNGVEFNTKHKKFNTENILDFMNNHLLYKTTPLNDVFVDAVINEYEYEYEYDNISL
jgi:hypothetical protein